MGIMKQKQEAVIGTLQWLHKSVGSTEGGALASPPPPRAAVSSSTWTATKWKIMQNKQVLW